MLPFWNTKNDPFVFLFFHFVLFYFYVSKNMTNFEAFHKSGANRVYYSITGQNWQIFSIFFLDLHTSSAETFENPCTLGHI